MDRSELKRLGMGIATALAVVTVAAAASASRVVCRCLEWPQAVSRFLKLAATLTDRSGEGASCCALRGDASSRIVSSGTIARTIDGSF
jgi:hypothetical protein